jgi:ribbon-helix-helix CopG family protein
LVQLELPPETVAAIDRLAADETISRAAWCRRALMGAASEAAGVAA